MCTTTADDSKAYDPSEVVSLDQLAIFDMLLHPVWIFDVKDRKMRWANTAGIEMWNAESMEELVKRDYATDMSESTAKRLDRVVSVCRQGRYVPDQWTFYPKGQAKTVKVQTRGIRLQNDAITTAEGKTIPPHMCLLYQGTVVEQQTELEKELLRGVEMLRHLPMAVCQFDMDGNTMFQNPEACLPQKTSTTTAAESATTEDSNDNPTRTTPTTTSGLIHRFVDPALGEQVLQKIQNETTLELEAMVHTRQGPTWSAIQLRQSRDPITGQCVLLYSALNRSDAMQAQKEKQAREEMAEFLAIMAHEIRTPMHQVTGFVDLLDGTDLNTEQKGFVGLLKSSSQGLMTVINDVLDYSKLEAGRMKLENIPYEPLAVVNGSMAAVRATCEERHLHLNLEWDKNIPFRLKSDPNRLRQILLNLLSNACKFTHQGGITVKSMYLPATTQQEKPSVRFEVVDTGIGISPSNQKAIFQKYQQANVSIARTYGGTGLGLNICCLLVEMMGGRMGVDSEVGHGSSFWFEVPAEVPSNEDIHGGGSLDESHNTQKAKGLQILVAEDNKVNQKLLVKMLQRMGHAASVAVNGKEAIDIVQDGKMHFDLCLMDIQMPVCDGYEATKRLRSMGYTDLPIYALSASVVRSDFSELGFNDWLPKPIRMKDLKAKLANHPELGNASYLRQ